MMPKSRLTSPRSERNVVMPRRSLPRRSHSTGSPARSTASAKLSNIVAAFKENNKDSFAVSPLSKTVLNDNTDIEMPRRTSWWRKVENSRDVIEVLENDKPADPNNILEEFDVEVLSQEKKNYSMDLPESSGSESISSIVLPQRKLFTQKENVPQKKFDQVISNRQSISKHNKTNFNDKTLDVGPKNLFAQTSKRAKPVFPSALLNMSLDKTANKTEELPAVKGQPKTLFGNRFGSKRKNIFADFIVSESEDEIPEIQLKRFTFHKHSEPPRRSSAASRGLRDPSPTSSITTDIEMEDWKLLPSSTMVEHQLQDDLTTPGNRARLSKLSEAKESTKDSKQSEPSLSSKNKSIVSSPVKNQAANKSHINDKSKNSNFNGEMISKEKPLNSTELQDKSNADNSLNIGNEEAKEVSYAKGRNRIINKTTTLRKSGFEESNAAKNNTTQNNSREDEKSLSENKINHTNEMSNIQDKTRVINKTVTLTKHHSKTQNDNEPQNENNVILTKVDTENLQDLEEDEEIVLTYDDNDHEIENNDNANDEQDNNENENNLVGDKNKTLCKEDNPGENPKRTYNFEESLPKTVEKENNVLQMETPMPNKSVYLTKRVIAETPESKFDNKNRNLSLDKAVKKLNQAMQEDIVPNLEKDTSVKEQFASEIGENVHDEIEIKSKDGKTQTISHPNEPAEVISSDESEDSEQNQIHTTEQDQAEASQEIETEEQTDAEQELEEDEEIEASENSLQEQNGIDHEIEEQHDDEEQEHMEDDEEDRVEEEEEVEHQESDDEQEVEQQSDNEQELSQEVAQQSEEEDENEEGDMSQEIENQYVDNDQDDEDQVVDEQEEVELTDKQHEEIHDSEVEAENDSENEDDDERNKSQSVTDEQHEEIHDSEVEAENDSENKNDDKQNESQNQDHINDDDSDQINDSFTDEGYNNDQEVEKQEETEQELIEETEINETHDTTGRHRKKRQTETPEAILNVVPQGDVASFSDRGRNTSIRKTKSILKNFSIRPSMGPPAESTGLSDGTKNSSAEGSGWDSHRTTRKTLRQTFGRDFTPRKSLRALVMEKSAKRQTMINEANAKLRQANQTELQDNQDFDMDVDENVDPMESDHDVSRRTRQTTLETYLQKIKKENMERKQKIEEQEKNSLKANPVLVGLNFPMPAKSSIRRIKPLQSAPKNKRIKPSVILLEELPSGLVEDMMYKPPKRFRPSNASWITKRLYKFLETKLEPKYDYKARIRAEKLVETIYNFVRDIRRLKAVPPHMVAELKREMARLNIVTTHFEFYNFFNDYLPSEIIAKVVPDIINDIPLPREGVFAPILV